MLRTCKLVQVPFNRTSMESKPGKLKDTPVPTVLLIEPVWNRNCIHAARYDAIASTFNRTSMESKLRYALPCVAR